MNRHNVLTKFIETCEALEKTQSYENRRVTHSIRNLCLSAEVFHAPAGGRFTDLLNPWKDAQSIFNEAPDMLRLPYPVTAIEFEPDRTKAIKGDFWPVAHLAICIDETTARSAELIGAIDAAQFAVLVSYLPPPEVQSNRRAVPAWTVHLFGVAGPDNGQLFYGPRLLFPDTKDVSAPQLLEAWREDETEISSVADFLLAYGATNVSVSRDADDNRKLNAARARRGKPPIFQYHHLVIEQNADSQAETRGGAHASPAMHRRRGHFRRLGGGRRTYIRPCIVGSPQSGIVVKDYDASRLSA